MTKITHFHLYPLLNRARAALYLSGIRDPQVIKEAVVLFHKLTYLTCRRNDVEDFEDGQHYGEAYRHGTDVECGCVTWLITTALEVATPAQKEILINNYGKKDPKCIESVVNLCLL